MPPSNNTMLFFPAVDRSSKRRQVKPLAASLLEALDYDSSDDSDFKVGDASGKYASSSPQLRIISFLVYGCSFNITWETECY